MAFLPTQKYSYSNGVSSDTNVLVQLLRSFRYKILRIVIVYRTEIYLRSLRSTLQPKHPCNSMSSDINIHRRVCLLTQKSLEGCEIFALGKPFHQVIVGMFSILIPHPFYSG